MIKEIITNTIKDRVSNAKTKTKYRQALVGYADATDSDFKKLKKIVAPEYKLPEDILSNAKSVIAFFIPFSKKIVKDNQHKNKCTKEWAIAYKETNELINQICNALQERLSEEEIKVGWEESTHNFDEKRLISLWSHRSAAKICGLGDFGLNKMLITEQGSAGRYGSLVIDKYVSPSDKFTETPCLYYQNGTCGVCIGECPTGALTKEGLDRHLCYSLLLKNDRNFKNELGEADSLFDVCGKCQVGPCAFEIPKQN
ncbi:hypothetical protein [Selenihalanaerobacter shriftii]|uniref:Epoxyqueuosine reductase QueG (Queuosine biosynthesis) n=1 Tax=Selenihalanaerobacter shriftii TaxID=142842 RepID=A0A1T4LYX2_9FIRM|nr:hypothetical protein [Selenihalanaerobacter shriftii]SJZ59857.1 hypothetical protein SAMN02745118_01306 [Selenihalanaerobacter shriftii]